MLSFTLSGDALPRAVHNHATRYWSLDIFIAAWRHLRAGLSRLVSATQPHTPSRSDGLEIGHFM